MDHFVAVGKGVLVAAPFQVFMDRHECGEPESGVGNAQDKGMGLGRGLAVGDGYGPLEAKFPGQPGEPDNGYFAGKSSEERIDAPSETSEFVHVGDHLGEFSLVSGGRRRLEIFSFPLNFSHLRPLRWIGRCRCYGRVGGGLGAVGRGAVFGHGMPWRLSGGLDLVWV